MAPKNIVVFIDGTRNAGKEGSPKNSNVFKLYMAARAIDENRQVCKYIRGVGTWGDVLIRTAGAAAALGLSHKIREAYRFICKEYKRERGDRIYLFGFSRGAFAARSLAGFVNHVGLLLKEHTNKVGKAFRLYQRDQSLTHSLWEYVVQVNPDAARAERIPLPIYFIGVWDTVGRIGLPFVNKFLPDRFVRFHKTDLPSNVTHGRHALALHELREVFAPEMWTDYQPPQSLKQTWFIGAHSDVGGGYSDHDLSDLALCWMAAEAKYEHLEIDEAKLHAKPNYLAPLHHEIRGVFRFQPPMCRQVIAKPTNQKLPWDVMFVHDSVVARYLSPKRPDYDERRKIKKALVNVDVAAQDFAVWLGHRPDACLEPLASCCTLMRIGCAAHGHWWDGLDPRQLAQAASLIRSILIEHRAVAPIDGRTAPLSRALGVLFILGEQHRLETALSAFVESRKAALARIRHLQTVEEIAAVRSGELARLKWIDVEVRAASEMLRDEARLEYEELIRSYLDEEPTIYTIMTEATVLLLRRARPLRIKLAKDNAPQAQLKIPAVPAKEEDRSEGS